MDDTVVVGVGRVHQETIHRYGRGANLGRFATLDVEKPPSVKRGVIIKACFLVGTIALRVLNVSVCVVKGFHSP